ncbi:alpha-(1,3)-fucosyltransferase C-like isoform X2 [Babylonia areolata]|uniref:alpha-(1,3)-fucosyltransferase C-like isoform X2 n=1 Tax=Babylonia areolata TaxID=304850 RepID=UPI003FCFB50B
MVLFRRMRIKKVTVLGAATIGTVVLVLIRYGLSPPAAAGPATHHHLDVRHKMQQLLGQAAAVFRNRTATKAEVAAGGGGAGGGTGKAAAVSQLPVKTVLMHTFPYFYELRSGPAVFSACDYPCTLTLDSELVEEVDSVVVYYHHFSSTNPLPRHRPRRGDGGGGQVWVFFAVESPINSRLSLFRDTAWRGVFNWTMTYRRDSDFYFGYGDMVKIPPPLSNARQGVGVGVGMKEVEESLSALVAGKSKMVAWFVSNCHTQSRREEFVEALKEFLPVDVYGQCGPLKCGREQEASCLRMLSRDYRFYLAFENSLCQDYVTEKLYHTMKVAHVVPVVRGAANYTALLPSRSFIDASAFATVRALAEHLKRVAGDPELYRSYLTWKREWRVVEPTPFQFCALCERLHHPGRWARTYPDIDAWWAEDKCHAPPPVVRS